jgi:hypothetical protein
VFPYDSQVIQNYVNQHIGADHDVPENTFFFTQKFTKMKPLHDASDQCPTHLGFHLAMTTRSSYDRRSGHDQV